MAMAMTTWTSDQPTPITPPLTGPARRKAMNLHCDPQRDVRQLLAILPVHQITSQTGRRSVSKKVGAGVASDVMSCAAPCWLRTGDGQVHCMQQLLDFAYFADADAANMNTMYYRTIRMCSYKLRGKVIFAHSMVNAAT